MSASSEEVVEEKIPWHFLIPFMVVLGFFLAVINPLNAAVMGWPIPPLYYYSSLGLAVICYSGLTVLPFMVFHIANALGRLNFFKKRINLMTMTWLYATTLYLTYYLGRPAAYTTCFNFAIFMARLYARLCERSRSGLHMRRWFIRLVVMEGQRMGKLSWN